MWGAIIGGAASLIGGAMGSDAAGDAADAQAASSSEAIAEQRRQYDLARADSAPFRDTGVAANQRLAYLLGLDVPASTAGGAASSIQPPDTWQPGQTDDPVWEKILADFNASHSATFGIPMNRPWSADYGAQGAKAGLDEQYRKIKAGELAANQPERGADYGSLTRRFSTADLASDPVYNAGLEFGLNEGRNAINARALAGGGYDSGATLKALTRFGNDYGSTKAEGAYNRYNTDNTNVYNRLAGVSGAGQTATNTVTTAGMNSANNISNLQTGIGNARAAGIVGGANAWGGAMSGVNNAYNNYQNRSIVDRILNRGGTSGYAIDPYSYADNYG